MELVLWLIGMAVLAAVTVAAVWVFRDRADRLDQRFHVSEQAARWRYLRRRWQDEPTARLATVHQVRAHTPRGGCQVLIVWTDNGQAQEIEIEHEQATTGDYLLLRDLGAYGTVTPRTLLARAARDAPACAERRR